MLTLGRSKRNKLGDQEPEPPDNVKVKHFQCDVKKAKIGMTI